VAAGASAGVAGGWADAARGATKIAAITAATVRSSRRPGTEGLVAHPLLNTARTAPPTAPRRRTMLETIAVILIILWLLGMVSGYTLGNFIYVLLVLAIVLFLVRLISGRRV
jgi:hypothetical protein